MDDLNKHQLILLVLLVTFVTSIATGIMTVSLLQQAPLEVTRTINQVVEKTIESVASTTVGSVLLPSKLTQPSSITTTVVVKEEDQIISSINKGLKGVVRIFEKDGMTQESHFFSLGVVVSSDGTIEAPRLPIVANNTYLAKLSDGTLVSVAPQDVEESTTFMIYKVTPGQKIPTLIPATLASSDLQLGQTIIAVGGTSDSIVSVGRVSSLPTKLDTATSTTKTITSIEMDSTPKDTSLGEPLFSLSGELVGVKIGDSARSFIPVSLFKKDFSYLTQ